jgi:hypothetical protein
MRGTERLFDIAAQVLVDAEGGLRVRGFLLK